MNSEEESKTSESHLPTPPHTNLTGKQKMQRKTYTPDSKHPLKVEKTRRKEKATAKEINNNWIKVMYTNCDQMSNKIDEIEDRITISNPHIIAINEVKPKAKKNYSMKDFNCDKNDHYNVISNNIDNDIGRGQLLYVKKSLPCKEVYMKTEFREATFAEIKLQKNDRLLITLIYRSESDGEEMSAQLVKLVDEICSKGYSHILMLGDFNYRRIDWESMCSSVLVETNFLNCIENNYLHQHIDEPTRWRGADKPSLLDLVLTNEENMISEIDYQAPVGNSDHAVIDFKFNCYTEDTTEYYVKKRYHHANLRKMRQYLEPQNWDEILKDMEAEEVFNKLKDMYDHLEEKYVPVVKKRKTYKDQMPLDSETLKLIKTKTQKSRKVARLKKRGKSDEEIAEAKREYNRARNKVRQQTRFTRRNYEKSIAGNVKVNTKPIYAYMKRRAKTKPSIGDIHLNPRNKNSPTTNCNKKKAEIFSNYFASVWTDENTNELPYFRPRNVKFPMKEIEITEDMVYKKLDKLKTDKTPVPGGAHPLILKELAGVLSKPITILFRKSLQNRRLPTFWKHSTVSVIFKSGVKGLAENYRPISLTSILCKMLESIIREHLVDHMLMNALFSDKQYGFIGGRSTALQLLRVFDEWTEAIDQGDDIDIIYMDYRKTFDTVPHMRLMEKVKGYGFTENIVAWIEDFLTERKQKVIINGEVSKEKTIKSGIPQGSVLGPLLFLIFVNDLPELTTSLVYLFADDNKVSKAIKNYKDKHILQKDLDIIYNWSKIWQLQIHPDKLAHMHIGDEMETPEYEYTVGNMPVKYSTNEKDLGVIIDRKLSFDLHINEKVKKANSMAGWIRRSFVYMDEVLFKLLYTAMVRMHLEYCAVVWSPYLTKYIDQLEQVQIRATKMVPGLRDKPYPERLKILKLPTLTYRRLRGDMVTVYKIMNNIYHEECCPKLPTIESATGRPGRQLMQLYQSRSRLDIRKFSFTQRVVSVWNSLPEKVVTANTLDTFKTRLDDTWKNERILYHYKEPLRGERITKKLK